MIETLLIANRGEIALRILRTAREMGLRTVAVYSDADRDLPFVAAADLALRLGAPPAAESYLDVEKLLALALGNGVDAIHPGYGFLAEDPRLSEGCARDGLVFVGPSAEVIRAMGDKGEAKRRMEVAGVPVVPGYVGEDQDEKLLRAEARRIGFPVLLKAVAGGGGRGIRLVTEPGAFGEALESARREATNTFGDGRMMIEKFVAASRHVEFQVLADNHGNVLHLFERECSIQRRHQKIVEETPSPALDDALRARMAEAAVRAASAIGYVGAGTVEFLLDGAGAFFFLEMNTRLQVEHPVTEACLGLDLVRLQIEVADGRPLPFAQGDLRPRGHAIECRLNAEDPARGFLPAAGLLSAFDFPRGPGLRVDAGFAPGATVTSHYDSLLAKLIAWGTDRPEALRRMGRLLSESRVAGIATNLPFLQGVVAHPAFRDGRYSTAFLEEHGEALAAPHLPDSLRRERLLAAGAVEACLELADQQAQRATRGGDHRLLSPWERVEEAPRLRHLPARLARRLTCGAEATEVQIEVLPEAGGDLALTVHWDGVPHRALYRPGAAGDAAQAPANGGSGVLELDELRLPLRWDALGSLRWLTLRGLHWHGTAEDPVEAAARSAGGEAVTGRLRAPLPGKVIKVGVRAGDAVAADQALLVMEAMKVEHTITAPFRGRVARVLFAEGEQVNRDDQLVELEPLDG